MMEALPNLIKQHVHELVTASTIDPEVVTERGYSTVEWTANDLDGRRLLQGLGIPNWARGGEKGCGLLIPKYRATGERNTFQFKPSKPVTRDGKPRKYAAVVGMSSTIDIHPRNRDRIVDPTVPLWITEGVKKADALTSRGLCVAALDGVFNWRSQLGTLGDWEDIPLRGREVVICFDSDAYTNPNVLRAMTRLGRWLESKGAGPVGYLVTPEKCGEATTKGVDDFLREGGTVDHLRAAIKPAPPRVESVGDAFTEAGMTDIVAEEVLAGRYIWSGGGGWLHWVGTRWAPTSEVSVTEQVRRWVLDQHAQACDQLKANPADPRLAMIQEAWFKWLTSAKISAAIKLARGHESVSKDLGEFDTDPYLLNCPNGVVDLRTGQVREHSSDMLLTKLAGVDFDKSATCKDWDTILEALPDDPDTVEWCQLRMGQAATGNTPPDDVMVCFKGGGENGKSAYLSTLYGALGDYAVLVPDKLLLGSVTEHDTAFMTLRGARLAMIEETPQGRHLEVARLKKVIGNPTITARYLYKDFVSFHCTHSLFLNTNYDLQVAETDRGVWRRLVRLEFPWTFIKPHEVKHDAAQRPILKPNQRIGDPGLRDRARRNPDTMRAALAYIVAGAVAWYERGEVAPLPTRVERDTDTWRADVDVVQQFATEVLVIDPDSRIHTVDMLAALNEFLGTLNHAKWSAQTVRERFSEHPALPGVESRKVKSPKHVCDAMRSTRKHLEFGQQRAVEVPPGGSYQAWVGVRFRTAQDVDQAA